ncbi:DNA-directed RNA polymerase specialized sigma24 family protein [Nocardiopsis mwathae]|uniref:DNA-directed RNA polymerase specialized sigma24 family protein n=1 Tax=Nocardiopsis mwathae TaxID=1472723 RepID=A0A7W9YE23_9ACTN|nr:hypothetical protein [Nocardiopsis mwathae]MBB6170377.1 DNA-directed RNA polymerase specialized sigma24 family protein [Nocardiopsis mwathae]
MTTRSETGRQRGEGSDADLAAQLREGRGFDRCYDTFAPRLYRYCWSLVEPADGGTDGAGEAGSAHPNRGGAEEPAAAALRRTFLSAAELVGDLGDRTLLRPWLFALARAASQRHGFATRSPLVGLATVAAERPAVEVARRLPPSHRELLELHLRHALPVSEIARILSLDTDIAGELCRASVRRAADVLSEFAKEPGSVVDMVMSADAMATGSTDTPAPELSDASRGRSAQSGGERPAWTPSDVARLLAVLEPPGPPSDLRGEILAACTGRQGAEARRRAAAELRPLATDGFPQHRERPVPSADRGSTGPSAAAEPSGASAKPTQGKGAASGRRSARRTPPQRRRAGEKRPRPARRGVPGAAAAAAGTRRDSARGTEPRREPRALPRDRITTDDVERIPATEPIATPTRPPGRDEDRSARAGKGAAAKAEGRGARKRRWPASAISGLVTVAASVVLSATAVFMNGSDGDTITDPGPPGLPSPPPLSGELSPENNTGAGGAAGGAGGSPGGGGGTASGVAPGGSGGTAPQADPGAAPGSDEGPGEAGEADEATQGRPGDARRGAQAPGADPSPSPSPSPSQDRSPPRKGDGDKDDGSDGDSGGQSSGMAKFLDDLKNFLG